MHYPTAILFATVSACLWTGLAQSLDGVILPTKTEIFVTLQQSVNSKTVNPGDKFSSLVTVPVTVQDQIIIPVGSYILGHVASKETAGYFEGKASLVLVFDAVTFRNGVTRQLRGRVLAAEDYETKPESGEVTGGGNQAEEVAVGVATGAVIGFVVAGTAYVFDSGRRSRAFEVGPAVWAVGGGLLALLEKGKEVELRRGTSLTIQLHDDVQLVKPQPHPDGQPMQPGN